MSKIEEVELTNMCMICDGNNIVFDGGVFELKLEKTE